MFKKKTPDRNVGAPQIIAIDTRPAWCNEAGIGCYTRNLLLTLPKVLPRNCTLVYLTIPHPELVQPKFYKALQNAINGKSVIIQPLLGKSLFWHFLVWLYTKKNATSHYYSPSSLIVPTLLGKKASLMVHDVSAILFPELHSHKTSIIEQLLLRLSLSRVSSILTPSLSTKRALLTVVGVSKNIYVIPHATDPIFLKRHYEKDVLKKLSLASQDYYITVGTLEPRKNFTTLLKSFKNYIEKGGKKKLLLVGRRGWKYETILLTYKNYLPIFKDQVLFYEKAQYEELPSLYHYAFACIYPTLYEGFGFPILEAFSSHCPVICSRNSSLPEVAEDAAFYITDSTNECEITKALFHLEQNEILYRMYKEKAKHRATAFSWKTTAKRTLAVLMNSQLNS